MPDPISASVPETTARDSATAAPAAGHRVPAIESLAGVVGVPDAAAVSVRDFLTDGSLMAVCDELTRTTGLPTWVRDRDGSAIIPADGQVFWESVPESRAAERAAGLAGIQHNPGWELFSTPLRTSAGMLGALVMAIPARPEELDGQALPGLAEESSRGLRAGRQSIRSVQKALTRLATAISEGCEAQLSLRQRIMELGALYRLSSLVVQTEDVDQLLAVALELAIDVLRADAGSIGLIEEAHEELTIKASRGLSDRWVAYSAKLRHGGRLRRAALQGEIVCVEDLTTNESDIDPQRVRAEGLCSLLSTGLMYHGRAIGLIRLYSRTPRWFTLAERGLLRSIADQSAAAVITARLRKLREEDERVRRQMRLAADVQQRMLPRTMPECATLDVAAKYVPSFALGGDFYDFIALGDSVGLVIGDVVGKGIAAALLMAAARASLRAHAQDVYDLSEVLNRVNAALTADTRDNEFATVWYGVWNPATHDLTYCNAGHNPPLLFHRNKPPEELELGGMVLGIDAAQRYDRGLIHLRAGDILVAYTDGVTDAANFQGARFGKERLRSAVLELLQREPAAPAAAIVEHVFWHLRQFVGLNAASDDLTLLVARVCQ